MGEIVHYLQRMAPAAVLGLGCALALRPARSRRLERRGCVTTPGHEVCLALFLMFLAGLLWLTVLPDPRRREGLGGINLKPFLIFKQSAILARQGNSAYFLINFWGNMAMFLPIGLFPGLLWRRWRWWKALLAGAGLSLFIELCQLPINRGTDIDDLWLNTLGAMAGWCAVRLAGRLWPGLLERCKIREGH